MNFTKTLILASKSPRRQALLKEAGIPFILKTQDVDETYPADLEAGDVASYIATKKAAALKAQIQDEIVLAADTVVRVDEKILGKPENENIAREMLVKLSGKAHLVTTGVCLLTKTRQVVFDETTEVHFRPLTIQEIDFYIDRFQPFDKAGAYGIQEWIGMVAVDKIVGSYFNVMGLPIHAVYQHLQQF
ncbi:Maf family nucleotide pyrophosphatase [Fulvivirgaceae bacterium BMA12]|uniref:dTTP/UTP pyrophosphatase n=1 Tax=Agaribacillus aureus TaxID=3051825 RepID=A0ABT8L6R5_9BACT|nr:Maf family nucleotide pyrophosphatase [Fulvivirgaceae bacterium BMA12]